MKKLILASVLVLMTSLASAALPFNAQAYQAAQERFKYQYGNSLPSNYYGPTPSYMEPKVVVKPQDLSPANMANRGTYNPPVNVPRIDPGHVVPSASALAKEAANQKALAQIQQQQLYKAMNIAPAPINNRR